MRTALLAASRARPLAARRVAASASPSAADAADPPSKTAAKREQRAWRAAADAATSLSPAQAARLGLPEDAAAAVALAATLPRRNQARKRQVGLASKLLAAGVGGDAASFAAAVAGAADGRAVAGAEGGEWLADAWRAALLTPGSDPAAEAAAFDAAAGAAADGVAEAPGPGQLRALVRAAAAEARERAAADAAAAAADAAADPNQPPPPRRRRAGAPAARELLRGLRPLAEWYLRGRKEGVESESEDE